MVRYPGSPYNNSRSYSSDQYGSLSEDSIPLLCDIVVDMKMASAGTDVEHCHRPEPDRSSTRQAQRQLTIASMLCFVFVIGELLGGYYSGSLAIMADAAHMFSDFASFGVSLFVIWLSGKKPRKTMTYGFYRAEALGALATVVIIWYVTGILAYLAVERLQTGVFEIEDNTMLIVAGAAVLFNITLGLCLHGVCCTKLAGHHGHSHGGHDRLVEEVDAEVEVPQEKHINIRAALIHVLGDLLQSVGVLISSILIKVFGESYKIADPICTLVFAVIVLFTTMSVLRDTLRILLEGTPKRVHYEMVLEDLFKIPGVSAVHDLHLWSLTADLPAASVHLAVQHSAEQPKILQEATRLFKNKYKIMKTTIQIDVFESQSSLDCVKCQPLDS